MADGLSIALSGALAQQTRLAGSASNIANLRTEAPLAPRGQAQGVVPGAQVAGTGEVSPPVETVQTPVTGANGEGLGTRAFYRPANPGFSAQYSPDSPFANDDGLVAVPNVSIEREATNQIIGRAAYNASLAALRVQQRAQDEAINLVA